MPFLNLLLVLGGRAVYLRYLQVLVLHQSSKAISVTYAQQRLQIIRHLITLDFLLSIKISIAPLFFPVINARPYFS